MFAQKIKHLLIAMCGIAVCIGAYAVDFYPGATVAYVSGVAARHGCNLKNNAADNIAVNMEYLLKTVDVCNSGRSNYGAGEYATQLGANTMAVDTVFATLLAQIEPSEPAFSMVYDTTLDSQTASFTTRFTGTFDIDWGDGNVQNITATSTDITTRSHTYASAGQYEITITNTGITDTAASASETGAAISFYGKKGFAKIGKNDGTNTDVSVLFPDAWKSGVGVDRTAMFYKMFENCTNLAGEIPGDLFAGIQGAPAASMFYNTFAACSKLTGRIPETLFAGLSGAPADSMFYATFYDCNGLTGEIPGNLFAGIRGAPATLMFGDLFDFCSGLTGEIPGDLFAGISGAPATGMFAGAFVGCTGLTSVSADLFAGVSGAPANQMFYATFYGCTGLKSVPANLFAGISGAPKQQMFAQTFDGCSALTTVPAGLFSGISGASAQEMFAKTFNECTGLIDISGAFDGIEMTSTSYATNAFNSTFNGCTAATSATPKITHNGTQKELWNVFSLGIFAASQATFKSATGLSNYSSINRKWR